MVVMDLGWVDLTLEYSTILLGSTYLAAVAAYLPGELIKSKSTQPRSTTTMVSL